MTRRKMTSVVQMRKFETVRKAVEENYTRISILRGVSGEQNLELARRLDECSEGIKKCNSLACKLCNRTYRLMRVN